MTVWCAKEGFSQCWNDIHDLYGEAADRTLEMLHGTDYFSAPASMSWHGAQPGGLLVHSVNVANALYRLADEYAERHPKVKPYPHGELAAIGLLHDVCKCGCYMLQQDGSYTWNPERGIEHGELSKHIVSQFLPLDEEALSAIDWHMGMFDHRCVAIGHQPPEYARLDHLYPLVPMTHIADMIAARVDEDFL